MLDKEVEKAIKTLKKTDYEYIKKVLKREQNKLIYDLDFEGWFIGDKDVRDFFYTEENTYLNPKELEGFINEIIEEEIFPIKETALDFISYYESKWGLDDITEDKIYEKVNSDAEFHIFEHMGLSEEVIKQLKNQGVDVK